MTTQRVRSERVKPDRVWSSDRRTGGPRAYMSRFSKLARTHALLAAADVSMAGVLAGSVFFSLDNDASRSKVLLYLLIAAAPMAIVAPFIGPTIDRLPGGRRFVVQLTAVIRAVLFILIAPNVDNELLFFPLVLGVSVMKTTYAVSRSALVPLVVNDDNELVEANSKLGIISAVSAAVAGAPLYGLSLLHPYAALIPGAGLCLAAAVAARQLPSDPVAERPAERAEQMELRAPALLLAVAAMALVRFSVGLLLFHLLFFVRADYGLFWLGCSLGALSAGAMIGNVCAPALRRALREEVMLTAALVTIAGTGLVATFIGGIGSAIAMGLLVGASGSVGRMAFDAIAQRSAPGANQGRAFARFEARFQLSWVAGGVVPALIPLPGKVGYLVLGCVGAFAAATYLVSSRAVAAGRQPPPTLAAVARDRVRKSTGRTPATGTQRPTRASGSTPAPRRPRSSDSEAVRRALSGPRRPPQQPGPLPPPPSPPPPPPPT